MARLGNIRAQRQHHHWNAAVLISHERHHMAMEESVVFPAILKALRPEDWADITLQLADRYGPPAQPDFEEKFSTLRRNILEMEEQAEAERPD